ASDAQFDATLDLAGVKGVPLLVREYRFDKDHNSYYRLGRRLRDEAVSARVSGPEQSERLQKALGELRSDRRETQLAALDRLAALGPAASAATAPLAEVLQKVEDAELRDPRTAVLKRIMAPKAYPTAVVRQVEELSALRVTGLTCRPVSPDGRVALRVRVAANGANYLLIEPVPLGVPLPW